MTRSLMLRSLTLATLMSPLVGGPAMARDYDPYTPPAAVALPPPPSYSSAYDSIDRYRAAEQRALAWQRTFNAAPSRSWEESNAARRRDDSLREAMGHVNAALATRQLSASEIEKLALEFNSKFNAAPSRSSIETFYAEARDASARAFVPALEHSLHGLKVSRREEIAVSMNAKFNAAPSRSTIETMYAQARDRALASALDRLRSQLRQLSTSYLYDLERSYGQKFNAAPSRSSLETYYKTAREYVQSELNYR